MVTASFGVSTAGLEEDNAQTVIARADVALYQAKNQGRNCVRIDKEPAVA